MDTKESVIGYRNLNEREIALMNECKELGEQVGAFILKLREIPAAHVGLPVMTCILGMLTIDYDAPMVEPQWVADGQRHLQMGFMCLTRAIARPTTF